MDRPFQVAIDGPVASGKGTVAFLVAQALGFLYIDTGAMYRAVALSAMQQKVSIDDEEGISEIAANLPLTVRPPTATEQAEGKRMIVMLDGKDVSLAIREPDVSANASKVAVYAGVRADLVKRQRTIAAQRDVVMEGRDITFRVLPGAQLKIFLTASVEKRAQRRWNELEAKGQSVTYDEVFQELSERDERDMNRVADPLHVATDAWVVDTTELAIGEVVEKIVARVKEMQAKL